MTVSTIVLLVHHDDVLREALVEQCQTRGGFDMRQAPGVEAALALARQTPLDLVLLKGQEPDTSCAEACARFRADGIRAPILILSDDESDTARQRALERGASDHIQQPFLMSDLIDRVRGHVRSFEQAEQAQIRIGPYQFYPTLKCLVDESGLDIRLTEKETSILKYLHRAGDKAVGRDELLSRVWGYNAAVTTHTLETHIYRLRQKIEPVPGVARLLVTADGGYRLAG